MTRVHLPGGGHARPLRLTLTIRQMMKLVVFGAAASLSIALQVPAGEIRPGTWLHILLTQSVAVPMVLALAALPLVRRGPSKDWLIRGLLMISVSVALPQAIWSLISRYRIRRIQASFGAPFDSDFDFLMFHMPTIILSLGLIVLLPKVVPCWCPDCRRLTLLPEGKFLSRRETTRERVRRCVVCQGRFRRIRVSWEAIQASSVLTSAR
jgi:hypothetical protein